MINWLPPFGGATEPCRALANMDVRAFFTAATVAGEPEPWNTLQLKVYYPAHYGDSPEERNMGFIPAVSDGAPYPVVIFMPGSNCHPEVYGWLAKGLCEQGLVCVTFSWIKEDMPGFVSLSPGFDLRYLTPDTFGQAPSCSSLPTLLEAVEQLNRQGLLAGLLDTDKIVLGGHSAGGNAVLLNSNRTWFPGIVGGFSYAAHTGAATQLGFQDDTLLPVASNVPMLIMGGERDGVIAASADRYGDNEDSQPATRIERTFDEALTSHRQDSHLVIVKGANHFCFTHPYDGSTGRPFLDWQATGDEAGLRALMLETISQFTQACIGRGAHSTLCELANHPHVSRYACK